MKNQSEVGFGLSTDPPTSDPGWTTIMGVAQNIRQGDVRLPHPDSVVYLPYHWVAAALGLGKILQTGLPLARSPGRRA
jgi:hypothetical protein